MVVGFVIWLVSLVILISSWPVGVLLAWLCKDEIIYTKWFYWIISGFLIAIVVFLVFYRDISILLTLFYMVLVTFVAIHKSRDKKFMRKK